MAWMKISEYLERFTPASRPDRRTVIARIRRGQLVGRMEGGIWYLDPDQTPREPTIQEQADAIFRAMSVKGKPW
jgi:hypothetical protein